MSKNFEHVFLTLLMMAVMCGVAAGQTGNGDLTKHADPKNTPDVTGTWSGTFYSKYSDMPPFTITLVITRDEKGHLLGASSLSSDCLKGAHLEVTVRGSQVVLAGSDQDGDNLTVRGTLDNTGALLKSSYILNGSANGKCETDTGTGGLAKR